MARYIDVEALKNDGHPCWHDGEGNIYYEVDHAPTADVVPKSEIEEKDIEIDILIKKKDAAYDKISELRAEVERLKNIYPCKVKVGNLCEVWANSLDDYDKFIGSVSEEGIKEFAERLKEELRLYTENNGGFVPSMIDNLVKEMVGD